MTGDRQRLDKWLWHARFARTRTAAVDLISSGYVRINGLRAQQAAKPVARGDVITAALPHKVMVVEVVDFADRRGGFSEAIKLYREINANPDPDLSGDQATSI